MPSKPVRLPRDVIIAIKQDLKAGYTMREICARNRVATATIYRVRDLKKIPEKDEFFRADTAWPCKHSSEKLEMIKKAYKAGQRVKDIAAMFQISASYVSNIGNGRERSAER